MFAVYRDKKRQTRDISMMTFVKAFGKTLDRMNRGNREEGSNERRRQMTLHSFRRFVKATISNLGYSDFSEWLLD
jgi:hypothetical protein